MKYLVRWSVVSLAICSLSACHSAIEQDFGKSVRQMQQAQQLHPELATNPPSAIVDVNDGQRLEGAMEIYRTENSDSERIREDIRVNVSK